jgi:hypothetical protein
MSNWIDIVRSDKFFNLIPANLENTINMRQKVHGGAFGISTTYEMLYEIKSNPDRLVNPPNYIAAYHIIQSFTDEQGKPHSEDPAPTQRVDHVAFMWVKGSIPLGHNPEQFTGFHRDDGFPALIEATNLRKHYYHGKLHRRNKRSPAIQAEYLFAHWYQHGDLHRNNGPNQLLFKNYREYWKDGLFGKRSTGRTSFRERGWPKAHNMGKLNEFLSMTKGKENPYGNVFFTHPADEFRYMTEFGPR